MFTDSDQPLTFLHDLLDENKSQLGLEYVSYGHEELVPDYPSVVLSAEPLDRRLHATRQFLVYFRATIFVLHAQLSLTKAERNLEDMQLATRIRKLIHSKYTMDENIIFGYITSEVPGDAIIGKSDPVVGTRMSWIGEGRVPYDAS